MNNFKRYFTVLVFLMLIFVLPSGVQGETLEMRGTLRCNPGYVCNTGFFQLIGTKWERPLFSISFKHYCAAVNQIDGYMPGWGGKGEDWKLVTIQGEYNYDTRLTVEKIIHEGKVVIQETLYCNRNPWVWGPGYCNYPTNIVNLVTVCNDPSWPVPLHGPYPLSIQYLPSDLFVALREWEKNKETPDPLAKWDPYAKPDGLPTSKLYINSPNRDQVIDKNAASFYLIIEGIPSVPPGGLNRKVLMRWEGLQEIPAGWNKDIYNPEVSYDWYPFNGPPFAWASKSPLIFTVAVNPGYFAGKPGRYRVQVKLDNETGWTSRTPFWIGPPTFKAGELKKIEAMAMQTQKKVMSAKMGGVIKSQGTPASTKVAKEAKHGMTLKQAEVVVESLAYKPAPTKPGEMVDLIITFKNKGQVASNASLKYSVSCTVKSGGPSCAVASSTRPINKAIPAGQTHSITLAGATPAVAGTYEVTVKPEGGDDESDKTITINVGLEIKPKGIIKPTKKQ